MERLTIYSSFDRNKIEELFAQIKKQFSAAKLEWYTANLPLTVGISFPDSCKNRKPSAKDAANCAIIKIKGRDAFFIAGKSFVAMTFFYRENFSEEDAGKITAVLFSPEGVAAQSPLSTEGLLVKSSLFYYAVLISLPIMTVAGIVLFLALGSIMGLLIIFIGVLPMVGPLMKARKIRQTRKQQAK